MKKIEMVDNLDEAMMFFSVVINTFFLMRISYFQNPMVYFAISKTAISLPSI